MGDNSNVSTADVVVIGLGPGGEDVAGRLAEAGLDVVGIDRELVGGECPYWGCVPSKMMIRAADLLAEARRVPGMAGQSTVRPDWSRVADRIRDEATDDWDDRAAVERFEGKGGRFVRGEGRIVGPGRVAVTLSDRAGDGDSRGTSDVDGHADGTGDSRGSGSAGDGGTSDGERTIEAGRAIVIATGARPVIPPIPGLDQVPYWTNRQAIEAKELPSSLIVLGGGAIGVELAQVFARFGVAVTVVESSERLVAMEEPEAGDLLCEVFEREGILVHSSAKATGVRGDATKVTVELSDGSGIEAEKLLVATGRRPDLAAVGVGALGLDESAKSLTVDDHLRVTDGVWAVGDITGRGAFTHMAMYQAPIAVADILGQEHAPAGYHAVPRVTFTDPEIGAVGLTEAGAREQGINVRTGLAKMPNVARGWIHKAGNDGLIKVVEDADTGVLVGATTMGPNGGEIIGFLAVAVHARVPTDVLGQMIYAYPTFHRGIEEALRQIPRP
jgi:pyruvate/2-oxoglutarate dehydrogenase complex dihydrolipoamide dehydrogenase (E3) component